MNSLTVVLAVIALLVIAVFAVYQVKSSAERTTRTRLVVSALTVGIILTSVAVYAALGRFQDWQTVIVDDQIDYTLAAKINELRRQIKDRPQNTELYLDLAQALMEGSRYRDAVQTLDDCLALTGPRADVLGMKAYVMYYRDGKVMTSEISNTVKTALSLDALDVQSHMLLGQDHFAHGRFEAAIAEWKKLLAANVAPMKEGALRNAIANAERRLVQKDLMR